MNQLDLILWALAVGTALVIIGMAIAFTTQILNAANRKKGK